MININTYIIEKLRINDDTKLAEANPIQLIQDYLEKHIDDEFYGTKVIDNEDNIKIAISIDNVAFKKSLLNKLIKLLNNNGITNMGMRKPFNVNDSWNFSFTFTK